MIISSKSIKSVQSISKIIFPKNKFHQIIMITLIFGGIYLYSNYQESLVSQEIVLSSQTNQVVPVLPEPIEFDGREFMVTEIVDGDTIKLNNSETVRYIGIDTPETKHPTKEIGCFGKEASEYNGTLVEGKTVRLESDISERDRYGRILAYVWIEGKMVNEVLVKEGYAISKAYPPDIKHQELLDMSQEEAREKGIGLWGECNFSNYNED